VPLGLLGVYPSLFGLFGKEGLARIERRLEWGKKERFEFLSQNPVWMATAVERK
jgi:hypothetical protein